jgi:protein PET117
MYKGVLRDDERRRRKMKEREEDFLRSHQKRELYERVQRVEAVVPLSETDIRGS